VNIHKELSERGEKLVEAHIQTFYDGKIENIHSIGDIADMIEILKSDDMKESRKLLDAMTSGSYSHELDSYADCVKSEMRMIIDHLAKHRDPNGLKKLKAPLVDMHNYIGKSI